MRKTIYLHPLIERIWHWIHAVCIIMLAATGIQIHWPHLFPVFGSLKNAVVIHDIFGIIAICDFGLWFLYNIFSLRIRHYLPTMEDMLTGSIKQGRYYAYGIFASEPHPFHASPENKFNPLQKISYAAVMFFFLPFLILSGILYMFPLYFKGIIDSLGGMKVIAAVHTSLAYFTVAFFIVHVYLTTTGATILSEIKSMFSGFKEEETEEKMETHPEQS